MPPTPEEIAAEIAAREAADAASAASDADNDDEEDNEEFDAEKAKNFIKELRQKERAANKTAKAAQTELEKMKQSQMSEVERAQAERDAIAKERDELRQRNQQREARDIFETEAKKLNAIRPDALFRLADIEYDEDGKPVNVRLQLNELKKQYPEMFGAAGGGDGNSGRGTTVAAGSVSDSMRRQLGRG